MAVDFAVAFEIFEAVLELHAVVFEETVDLHAGFEAKQLAQEERGDFAGTIGLESESLQRGARQILALRGEGSEKLVRKRNGDVLHGVRIQQEWFRTEQNVAAGRLEKTVVAGGEELEEAEVPQDLELLAEFGADVAVGGVKAG